jgi:hypothetical protein
LGAVAGRQGWQLGPEATRRAFAEMRSVRTRGGRAGSCSWLAPSLSCPFSLGGWTGRGRRVGGWPVRLGRALVRGTQGSPGGRRWAAAAAAAMGLRPRRRDAGAAAQRALQGPGGAGEGVCGRRGTFGCRESIFKISHTKCEPFAHFPDARSDVARARLQMARVVYEGGRHRAGREGSRAASRQGSRVWRLRVAPAPPLPAGAQKPPRPAA